MYEKLSKNALKCLYISTTISCGISIAILLALEVLLFMPNNWKAVSIIGWGGVAVTVLDLLISPWFRFNRYRYKIDDEAIDIVEGYLFQERNIVPIERLHKLEVNSGPIDRICNVAKVTVTTAGGDVTLRFLDQKKAEQITEGLKKRINQLAVEAKQETR